MLKSSLIAAGEPIAVTTPSAMSSTWVSVPVCVARAEDLQRPLPGSAF